MKIGKVIDYLAACWLILIGIGAAGGFLWLLGSIIWSMGFYPRTIVIVIILTIAAGIRMSPDNASPG